MEKKVVVLGGGTGLSVLLRGLKLFPLDITAVVSVSDDGGSTGKLRDEFNIPAIGDLRQVLVALSETEPLVEELLQYRFKGKSDLNGHPTGNLLLAALLDITGSLSEAIEAMSKILNIKGKVLPLTEDKVTLIAKMEDGTTIEGESNLSKVGKKIKQIKYKEDPEVNEDAIKAILDADLIVFGMGSLYTSLIPNLIIKEVKEAINQTKAKKLFVSNIMTEHGETDNFKVSDLIKTIKEYIGENNLNAIIANNGEIDPDIKKRYFDSEHASLIKLDTENIKDPNIDVIEGDFVKISLEKDLRDKTRVDKMIRHDELKLALQIYTYIQER